MFTGIVQAVGEIKALDEVGGDVRVTLDPGALRDHSFAMGDSIAINGTCLTVVDTTPDALAFDVSKETLAFTTLGSLGAGSRVNLEPAATADTALGGHIVSGHVDTVATIISREDDARSVRMVIEVEDTFARYIARKGSVCIDGVSLTVNGVDHNRFDINLVPHTLEVTIINGYTAGTRVNLEVDVVARYVERLLESRMASSESDC